MYYGWTNEWTKWTNGWTKWTNGWTNIVNILIKLSSWLADFFLKEMLFRVYMQIKLNSSYFNLIYII